MAFHEVQFPTDISYQSAGGPEFSTQVVVLGSGHERRNANWSFPRERWDVGYGIDTQAKLQSLLEFFYAREGKLHGFRFKNHDDYEGTDEVCQEDSTDVYQCYRNYSSGGYTFSRKITKLVLAAGVTVKVNGGTLGVGQYTVNYNTGTITMASGAIVSSGDVVTATFEFDVPVRFDVDYCPVRLETYLARSAAVSVVELPQS